MTTFGEGLMSAPPKRPGQDESSIRDGGPEQATEQAANLGQAQRVGRPRWALKVARLPVGAGWNGSPPFCAAGSLAWARMTVRKACARQASVIWRYQPVQERTSY